MFVIESTTKQVNKESIEPNIASVIASGKIVWKSWNEINPSSKWGNPKGISPIVFTSKWNAIDVTVPITSAKSEAGQYFAISFGVKNITTKAITLKIISG